MHSFPVSPRNSLTIVARPPVATPAIYTGGSIQKDVHILYWPSEHALQLEHIVPGTPTSFRFAKQ